MPLNVFLHAAAEDRACLAARLGEAGFDLQPPMAPRFVTGEADPALLDPGLDLILAGLPADGEQPPGAWVTRTLALLKQNGLRTPLIVIAGPDQEDFAAALLEQGAADYLCRDRLQHLGAAVRRAVSQRKESPGIDAAGMDAAGTNAEWRQEQARYHALFEHARDIYLFVRLDNGRILEANRAAERAYGYSRAELRSMHIADLRAPETRALVEEQMRHISDAIDLANHDGVLFETWHRRKDGAIFPVEVSAFGVSMDGAKVSLSIIHDISQRKMAERAMERRMIELEALHDVAQAGTEARSMDGLIEQVVRIIRQCLFPDEFGVAFLDASRRVLTYHPSAYTHLPPEQHTISINTGISGYVARTGKLRREGDVRQCPDFHPSGVPVLSEVCVPLVVSNEIVGVLNAESVVLNYFSASDERLLVAVAGELATAIAKIRLLEAERARREELESLAQISAVVRSAVTRADMLPGIVNEMCKVVNADGTAVAVRDPRNGELVFELGAGNWQSVAGLRIPPGEGIGGLVVDTRLMLYLDQEDGPHSRVYRKSPMATTRCVVCLPLIAHEAVIGLLYLGRSAPFSPSALRMASAAADIISSAFDRVRLFEKTRQQVDRLMALRAIDQSILAAPDLERTLAILMESFTGLLGVDAANILLYDPRHQMLLVAAETGMPPRPILPRKVAFETSRAWQVVLERKMEFIPDLTQVDEAFSRRLEAVGARFTSYLALPLVAKDSVKGVVEIFQRERLEPSADWMDFLHTLTNQVAIAIDNALLFKEQKQTTERLKEAYEATIDGWSRALDMRDEDTEGHSRRVTELTMRLARRLEIPAEQLAHIRRGAQLHDIGKMGIPDSILLKPGPLTPEEWVIMRRHPEYALDFLYDIEFLAPALEIPYCHHEKWDGSGYPQGLRGEQIPLAARIFAVVDVWDALTSTRPYRPAWPAERALAHIRAGAGTFFEPRIVEHFLAVLSEMDAPQGDGATDPMEAPPPDA